MSDVSQATVQLAEGASGSQQAAEALDELAKELADMTSGALVKRQELAGVS